jgi:hypothetical protein
VIQQSSEGRLGALPDRTAASHIADDWPVYVAFLPSVVIGIAAAMDFTTSSYPERRSPSATSAKSITAEADDYVQGLARLGVAKTPAHGRPRRPPHWPREGSQTADELGPEVIAVD